MEILNFIQNMSINNPGLFIVSSVVIVVGTIMWACWGLNFLLDSDIETIKWYYATWRNLLSTILAFLNPLIFLATIIFWTIRGITKSIKFLYSHSGISEFLDSPSPFASRRKLK